MRLSTDKHRGRRCSGRARWVNYFVHVALGLHAALFSASAIGGSGSDPHNPFSFYPFALPQAQADYFQGYREQWSRLTGFEYSGLHWKQFIAIFSNTGEAVFRHNYRTRLAEIEADEEEEDFEGAFKAYAPGTILLKENYTSHLGKPSDPLTLTIMIKRASGYDPKRGDWEYLQTSVDGAIIVHGNSQNSTIEKACAECHNNVSERDYIFSSFYNILR